MKRRILVSILIILIACAFAIIRDSQYEYSRRIFADVSELHALHAYTVSDADDPSLGALIPAESYCKTILYDRAQYLVCAYVFDTHADALAYYQSVWGTAFSQPQSWWARSESSPQHTEYMVFYDNRVLRLSASVPHKKAVAFENMLAQSLTVELPK